MAYLQINCDGGSRGNPGPAASAFVVTDPLGTVVHSAGIYLGTTTNNQAEYQAVIAALEWLHVQNPDENSINFVLDSELVVKQITGLYKVKDPAMQMLHQKVHQLLASLSSKHIHFRNVLRADNASADLLVNQILDAHTSSAR